MQIRFVRDNSLGSRLIRWFSHGDWSHVEVISKDRAIGARLLTGVAIKPQDYVKNRPTLIINIPMKPMQERVAQSFLMAQVGKPYDWRSIFAFALKRNWRKDDTWFCSELVAAVCEKAGVFPHRLLNSDNKITPSDLLLALSVLYPAQEPSTMASRPR